MIKPIIIYLTPHLKHFFINKYIGLRNYLFCGDPLQTDSTSGRQLHCRDVIITH